MMKIMENKVTAKVLKEIEVDGVALLHFEMTDNGFTYRTIRLNQDNPELQSIFIENLFSLEYREDMRNNVVNKLDFTISTTSWGSLSPDELQDKINRYQKTIDIIQKLKLELDRYQLEINLQEKKKKLGKRGGKPP